MQTTGSISQRCRAAAMQVLQGHKWASMHPCTRPRMPMATRRSRTPIFLHNPKPVTEPSQWYTRPNLTKQPPYVHVWSYRGVAWQGLAIEHCIVQEAGMHVHTPHKCMFLACQPAASHGLPLGNKNNTIRLRNNSRYRIGKGSTPQLALTLLSNCET